MSLTRFVPIFQGSIASQQMLDSAYNFSHKLVRCPATMNGASEIFEPLQKTPLSQFG
jgi:hypothetical protein